jgi:hypothetical protein
MSYDVVAAPPDVPPITAVVIDVDPDSALASWSVLKQST